MFVSRSVVHENWPLIYESLSVVSLHSVKPPPWYELAVRPEDILREPLKEDEVVVALIENILDILATIPDEEAISKYASGVESPNENLPNEVDEMVMNLLPRLL